MVTFYTSDKDDKIKIIIIAANKNSSYKSAVHYFRKNSIPGIPVEIKLFHEYKVDLPYFSQIINFSDKK